MESSPLTIGYDHARAASVATQSSDTTVAINEHTLAAGEFSKAASQTSSMEALRTLRLLEQHHQRLAQLLRFPTETLSSTTTEAEAKAVPGKSQSKIVTSASKIRGKKAEGEALSLSQRQNSPVLRQPRRPPPRDLTSSIASNLATARGIRSNYTRQPLSPSISIYQAPGSLESLPRKDGKRVKVPTIPENTDSRSITSVPKQESKIEVASTKPESRGQDGFSRFYSTFEDIFSKISAPLAFAGLPLIVDESSSITNTGHQNATGKPSNSSKDRIPFDEIDLTKHFSRAALRASTRNEYTANDSFYVVPTTGHTVSYAHIISFEQKERQRMASSVHPKTPDASTDLHEDDFVDAREMPSLSTSLLSRNRTRNLSSRERENKLEELTTENASLKLAMDKLSKRLHAFEISAQYNSMALAESVRLMRDRSPAAKDVVKGVSSESGEGRLRRQLQEVEGLLKEEYRKNDILIRENEKLRSVVTRYRERWEKLKEGAKSRREGKDGGTGESHAILP